MKWLLAFLLGVVAGAIGMGAYMREMTQAPIAQQSTTKPGPPPSTTPPPVVVAPPTPAPATPPPPSPPPPSPAREASPPPDAISSSPLLIPVAGVTAAQLNNTFDQARGTERRHEAIDILAPTGTEVFAVADGKLVKLFNSKPGGITLYQFDTTEKYAYYYAHLDRYAAGIKEGMFLKRGDLIGYVGYTGNADPAAPHLHFAVFELGPQKEWWKGTPVNPYALMGGQKRH